MSDTSSSDDMPQISRPYDYNSRWEPSAHLPTAPRNSHLTSDPSNLPSGSKSLSGISIRSFLLGQGHGTFFLLTLYIFLDLGHPLWRAPFFLTALTAFHFLEYYVTARYNTDVATIDAFLLSQNGAAYNFAHTFALTECIVTRLVLPEAYFTRVASIVGGFKIQVALGLFLVILGQSVRTVAMAQAGRSFNHTVQWKQKQDHVLVTEGLYSVFRHPSYFGFFWWALGTQLVLGNVVSFSLYALVLWRFFSTRIYSKSSI